MTEELRASAFAGLAIGDLALLATAFRVDHPGREVLLFLLVTAVLAVIWATVGASGRIRALAQRAASPPPAAVLERVRDTRRRVLVGLLPVAVVMAVLVAIAPGSAALIAGVPAGIGAGDLWVLQWVRNFERRRGDTLLREAGSPFTARQRGLYTLPMNEVTDPT